MGKHYTLADSPQLQPIELANQQNVSVTADTDILVAGLTALNYPCLFRIMVAFSAAGILRVTITKGGDTQISNFNSGNNLAENAFYMFDSLVHGGDAVNFRYSVGATLRVLRVEEIDAGVQ